MASERSESPIMVPSTPPPQSNSADMTPPPSTQPPKPAITPTQPKAEPSASFPHTPPLTIGTTTLFTVPGAENIDSAEPEELRRMIQEMNDALKEARVSAAHWKMQYELLSIESKDAAERAEVEHQMTRREVEVLTARNHGAVNNVPRATQQLLDTLTKCIELKREKAELEHRLDKAKKLIEKGFDRCELLEEEVARLKFRIRENREHFNIMRNSPFFHTLALVPQDFAIVQQRPAQQLMEPPRSHVNNRSQDPFAALLAADQVLNGEAASLPATPTQNQSRPRQGHTRGAFSLSSLQRTPAHSRPETAIQQIPQLDGGSGRLSYSVPNTKVKRTVEERDKRDRDSTISISEEEILTDEDLPQSQASSLATNMLRRNPGSQGSSFPGKVEKSSKVLQSKLFGQVKKAGIGRKRNASFGDNEFGKKTAKLTEGVGLGIGTWKTSKVAH